MYRGQIYLAPLAPVGKERPRRQELQQEVRRLQTENLFWGGRSGVAVEGDVGGGDGGPAGRAALLQ